MKDKRTTSNAILTVALTLGFASLGYVFRLSYLRLWETLRDLAVSAKIYGITVLGLGGETLPTVVSDSSVLGWDTFLPDNLDGLKAGIKTYFSLLFNRDNFIAWLQQTGNVVIILSNVLMFALPCLLLLVLIIIKAIRRPNNNYGIDTLPLQIFKRVSSCTYQPIKRFVLQYVDYVKNNKIIYIVWIVIWAFHLNLASIVFAFIAYYLYFAASFDLGSLIKQFGKLFIDLQVIFKYFPYWTLLPAGYLVFDWIRRKIGYDKLQHMESKNRGFIKELPIGSMTCGSMGKKKTTVITDMALSQEVLFRGIAFERLQKCDMKFPYFPWISFERELAKCMEYGTVYNLATVKEWIRKKRFRYDTHGDMKLQLYGYDVDRYGDTFDDKLKVSSLWDVLETYAELFFIYVVECSLIVSNYSIREDNVLSSKGNFPIWQTDFFPKDYPEKTRYSHILDFDVLRLGKKVLENNEKNGSFEFGVIAITEIGKERGNNLELKEVKKGTEETNQKNDLFNSWLKMCRHSATVDNFPFIKVFTDEQRPESWGADARDLCDVIRIISSSDLRLAMPFYTIEDMLTEWVFNRFMRFYYDMRYRRGDNTLTVYLCKIFAAWLFKRNLKILNTFGYSISSIEKERGTLDGKPEYKKYYLMNKKIYSTRFSTDCFSDYFNDMAKKTKVGLRDYVEYATEKASVEELKKQNSYFINSLYKEE